MSFYVEIFEPTQNLCMICNCREGTLNIFTDTLENEDVLLHEALEFITCLKVLSEINVSRTLCTSCNARLLDAYRFKNKALEAYKVLQDISTSAEITFPDENGVELQSLVVATSEPISESPKVVTEIPVKQEIDMSTDAVTFLLQHHLLKAVENEPERNLEQMKDKKVKKPKPRTRAKLKYECNMCNKLFRKKSNLDDHTRLHNNEKKFMCSYCDKSFVQIANLRTHERTHTMERPYECPICLKTYSQSSTLKVHIRSHTQERNYICSTCSKAFTNSTDLNKHMRLHDPSKRFKCEFCGKSFVQKGNMQVHQRKIHGKEVKS